MHHATASHPVVVGARLDHPLSRWLWLVKWLLLIPHYLVLMVLYVAFFVVSLMALVAIVFTGRYPRDLFEFNLGVLRWGWRVAWYGHGGLATDHYPPFTLAEVPDYPATLDIARPETSPRGRSLVQWWLLAAPHYLLLALLGSGVTWVVVAGTVDQPGLSIATGGLVGVLAFFAGVVLLVRGRYPADLAALLAGLNRWVLRVVAYGSLMTTSYPPFRLDQGGEEPWPPADHPSAPTGAAGAAVPTQTGSRRTTSSGSDVGPVVVSVVGVLLLLPGLVLTALGAIGLLTQGDRDGDGFVSSPTWSVSTTTSAVTTGPVLVEMEDAVASWLPDEWQQVRVSAGSADGDPVFLGVGPRSEVDRWLSGVAHDEVRSVTGDRFTSPGTVRYDRVEGDAAPALPGEQPFWAVSDAGTGAQEVLWTAEDGEWVLVLTGTDGQPGVAADVGVAVDAGVVGWVSAGVLVTGLPMLFVGSVLLVLGSVAGHRPARADDPTAPPVGGAPSGRSPQLVS